MASVTIPPALGGSGTTYSDGTGANGMASNNGYGYNALLLTMLAEAIAACQTAVNAAAGFPPVSGDVTVNGTINSAGNITAGSVSTGRNVRVYSSSYGNNGFLEGYGTDGGLKFQAGALGVAEAFVYGHTGVDLSLYAHGGKKATFTSAALDLLAGQIKFPASQAVSADANTLDDYEEGTFTVTDQSSAGLTLTANGTARYTKVGRLCVCHFDVTYPATADAANHVQLGGFPFTADSMQCSGAFSFTDIGALPMLHFGASGSAALLCKTNGNFYVNSELSGKRVQATVVYRTAN